MNGRFPRTREELLSLFPNYVPQEYVHDIVAQLERVRPGPFRLPEKVLIILFASRSGSNYLGQLLSSAGWFKEIGESFAPHQLKKIRDRYALADLHGAAQWMIDNRGTRDAFGFKAGFAVLMAAAELGVLSQMLDRSTIVLLRRRDRLAQAVSLVKSKLAGRTHSGQQEEREVSDADYDAEQIAFQLWLIEERERQFADLTQRLGKEARIAFYEDICTEPRRYAEEICESMGLAFPTDYEPKVRVKILRDEVNNR